MESHMINIGWKPAWQWCLTETGEYESCWCTFSVPTGAYYLAYLLLVWFLLKCILHVDMNTDQMYLV